MKQRKFRRVQRNLRLRKRVPKNQPRREIRKEKAKKKLKARKMKRSKKFQWTKPLSKHTHLLSLMQQRILSHRTQFNIT